MSTMNIRKDLAGKKITVIRNFDSSLENVWKAWTDSSLLEKWWAPKPYSVETKEFSFTEGGKWLYAMVSPENQKHWAQMNYTSIDAMNSFEANDMFCNENGERDTSMPSMIWKNEFSEHGDATKVTIHIFFKSEEDLNKILETGFEEGFASGLNNLDEYLKTL